MTAQRSFRASLWLPPHAAAWVFGLLLACSAEQPTATQLIVVVDSDLAIDTQLRRVEVAVADAQSGEELDTGRFQLSGTAQNAVKTDLPFSLGVARGGAERIELVVRGFGPLERKTDALVIESRSLVEFVAGETRLVRVFLSEMCRMRSCPDRQFCYTMEVDETLLSECSSLRQAQTFSVEPGREHEAAAGRPAAAFGSDGGAKDAAAAQTGSVGSDAGVVDGGTQPPAAGASGGGGSAAVAGADEDAGAADVGLEALDAMIAMISAHNRGIDGICDCYTAFSYESRHACVLDGGGYINAGHSDCLSLPIETSPAQALPTLQCMRGAYERYVGCLGIYFSCPSDPNAPAALDCNDALNSELGSCPTWPDSIKSRIQACTDVAHAYAEYVPEVNRSTERVCRCYSALGYDSLSECHAGEGIVDSEFNDLEDCFFAADGMFGPTRSSVELYFTCDQTRMAQYASCMDTDGDDACGQAIVCRNSYRIERTVCRNQANLLTDPLAQCTD